MIRSARRIDPSGRACPGCPICRRTLLDVLMPRRNSNGCRHQTSSCLMRLSMAHDTVPREAGAIFARTRPKLAVRSHIVHLSSDQIPPGAHSNGRRLCPRSEGASTFLVRAQVGRPRVSSGSAVAAPHSSCCPNLCPLSPLSAHAPPRDAWCGIKLLIRQHLADFLQLQCYALFLRSAQAADTKRK
jgi:hypothetical protein